VPSLITTPVRYGALPLDVVTRATVSHNHPVTVQPPPNQSEPEVVTSVNVRPGERVSAGQLIATVAEQPVFVMAGPVPAFRPMVPGTTGIDVRELQSGLAAAGYRTDGDQPGTYGPATAAAVLQLYRAKHLQADVPSGAGRAVAQATAGLARAERRVAAATRRLVDIERRHGVPSGLVAAARRALATANAEHNAARAMLQRARVLAEPIVPLGAVSIVPHLPATVLSVAALGSTLGQSTSGGAGGPQCHTGSPDALARIGSARVVLTAAPSQGLGQLRRGMTGTATSEITGTSLRVRVLSVGRRTVVFRPVGQVPLNLIGQNVEVNLVARRVRSFVVPVSAVSTSGSGRTYITVIRRSGAQRTVWVTLGLATNGQQAISAVNGRVRAGEEAVIGRQAR
jgi:peptidoglycan hydrolase-like protein with peptidoglycan-binding domain